MRGRRSYFGFCETPEVLIGITRLVWLRFRAALRRQWKTLRPFQAARTSVIVRGSGGVTISTRRIRTGHVTARAVSRPNQTWAEMFPPPRPESLFFAHAP